MFWKVYSYKDAMRLRCRRFGFLLCAALLLWCTTDFCQTRLEFEVTSIRPAPGQAGRITASNRLDSAQVRFTYISLRDCIARAYRVQFNQVIGPDWLGSQRFEITAKIPNGTGVSQVPEMLQSMLADRFQIKIHRETREFAVYALEVARSGLQIQAVPPDGQSVENEASSGTAFISGTNAIISYGSGSSFTFGPSGMEFNKLTMSRLAEILTRYVDRPVVDATGLKEKFNFALNLSPEDGNAMWIRSAISAGVTAPPEAIQQMNAATGDSLQNGLQKIGLTFASQKQPLEVLVVENIRRLPTAN